MMDDDNICVGIDILVPLWLKVVNIIKKGRFLKSWMECGFEYVR